MTDTKYDYLSKIGLGYDSTHYTAMTNVLRYSDRLVSLDNDLLKPVETFNAVQPVTVGHAHRFWQVELQLDTDNASAFETQQVTSGDAASRALKSSAANSSIGYLVAQFKDTAGNNVSHSFEAAKTYLTYAKGICSNEHGVQWNPSTYRFICVGSRTVGTTNLSVADSTQIKYTGVNKVTVNGSDVVNVLSVEWEFLADIMPIFVPNTYTGLGVKEWTGKYWVLRVTTDTKTDAFDSYINQTGANAVIPTLSVLYNTSAGGTATHTYEASKSYISRVDPAVNYQWQADRKVATYEVSCIGTRVIT